MYNENVNVSSSQPLLKHVRAFFEAEVNLFIFLTYFFSISNLLHTLLYPWKDITVEKKIRYFSLSDIFHRHLLNAFSSLLGLTMRLFLISFYFFALVILVIQIPFAIFVYVLLLPFLLLHDVIGETEKDKKNKISTSFVTHHLLDKKNSAIVSQWAELEYTRMFNKQDWWKLERLLSIPPLARDWAYGYTPTLDNYSEDLTHKDYQKVSRRFWGRQNEVRQLEENLLKENGGNIIIVGEQGVGKDTIIDALAKKIYFGQIDSSLRYKRLLKLNMEKILSEFTDQKQREEFLETLISEASQAKNVILFIEGIERYISSQWVDLSTSFLNLAKSQSIHLITTTTSHAYEKWVFPNEQIRKILYKLDVREVSADDAEHMLMLNASLYEKRCGLIIPYEAIHEIIQKSDFHISYIPFPEKAFDLLENVCVYTKLNSKTQIVDPASVDAILKEKTHREMNLSDDFKKKLIDLEKYLSQQVQGQPEAISKIVSALQRLYLLHNKRKKPLATFLLMGPTGVGKTLTAKVLATYLFEKEDSLIRIDMSNYQSLTDIQKLVGSEEKGLPGLLTEKIREFPYGILLLDELEKAHPDLLNIFLTILDEGYYVDGYGTRVDCKNLIIIATTNAASDIKQDNLIDEKVLIEELIKKNIFSPEFLNRFDEIISYKLFQKESLLDIARASGARIIKQIKSQYNISVFLTDEFLLKSIERGYNEKFGIRNLDKLIEKDIESRVAEQILHNDKKTEYVLHI